MIRRTLESLCNEQKAEGENLDKKIKDLAKKNIIPKTLSEMTDILRIFGNMGAHASNFKITLDEIEAIEDFLNAILEYVYIAPAKLERIKKRLNDNKDNKTRVASEDLL